MPDDIAVTAVPPVQPLIPAVDIRPQVTAPPTSGPASPIAYPTPSYKLDAEIGIVVTEFRSQSGKVVLSIPSQQQLDAYAADPLNAPTTGGPTIVA